MKDYEEFNKIIEDKKQFLSDWLDRYHKVAEIAPIVNKMYLTANVESQITANMPSEIKQEISCYLKEDYNIQINQLKTELPPLPDFNVSATSLNSTGASSTVFMAKFISDKVFINDKYKDWGIISNNLLMNFQDQIKMRQEIKSFFKSLNIDLFNEYELLENAYYDPITGLKRNMTVTMIMRSLLEHFRGRLWQVLKKSNEQKLKWEIIAERLSNNDMNSPQYHRLIRLEEIYNNLYNKLSKVAKNNDQINSNELNSLYVEYNSYLHSIILIIDITDTLDTASNKS